MNEHEDGVLISAYLDGELEGAELERLGSHLKACAECRLELESLRRDKHRLAAAPRRALPTDLIFDLERGLKPARRGFVPAWLARPRFLIPTGVFATAVLAVGLWLGLKANDASQSVPLEPLMAAHERYSAESLVPQGSLVSVNYIQLAASSSGEAQDQESD